MNSRCGGRLHAGATASKQLSVATIPSPLGELRALASDAAVVGLYLPAQVLGGPAVQAIATKVTDHPLLARLTGELADYFRGTLRCFTVPKEHDGTPFQRQVWAALGTIPFGERRSYRWLADAIGRPRAVQAVGAANARNALSILVPCHRVVGADGSMTGYAGGLDAKRWLLAHEERHGAALELAAASGA